MEKIYVCHHCMESSDGQYKKENFVLTSSLESSYKCQSCLTSFNTGYESGNKFACDVCPRVFSKQVLLKCHSYKHTNMWPYRCEVCGKGFAFKSELLYHTPTHSDKKPTKCSSYICNLCMESSDGQYKKEDFAFVSSSESSYECENCLTPFSTGYESVYKFACNACPRVFTKLSKLKYHSYEHTNKWPYWCEVCGKGFACKSQLLLHAHSNKSPKQCSTSSNYCMEISDGQHKKKDFVSTLTLESSYEGENFLTSSRKGYKSVSKFVCDVCPRVFSKPSLLTWHSYTHTHMWPYFCEKCGKGFACKSYLHKHVLSHSEERPFPCSFCTAAFKRKFALNQHLTTHNRNTEL